MQSSDFCIAGGGIIGLTLALELHRRGATVTVVERDRPLGQASQAAAGMLAADDPDNPAPLQPLSRLSLQLYPELLDRLETLSGQRVPFQTTVTYQQMELDEFGASPGIDLPGGPTPVGKKFARLEEHSLDPRQLAPALLAAVQATPIRLLEGTAYEAGRHKGRAISTLGPWGAPPVGPRKGQMMAVRMPHGLALDYVVRTHNIYIVPRLQGPRAGLAVIGATVEDVGFSTATEAASLRHLRRLAASLIPALADETNAPMVDQWAGLRPYTPDHLPIIGEDGAQGGVASGSPKQFVATGHYRNGILLAPATAHVMAQLVMGEATSVDLAPFSPARFRTG